MAGPSLWILKWENGSYQIFHLIWYDCVYPSGPSFSWAQSQSGDDDQV